MKRLLNDPLINDTGWLDHNKKVKRETNLQSDNKDSCSKWHPSRYWHRLHDGPIYEGQVKCFSSRSLLGLPRLSNKCVTDQFRMALARRQMSLSASIINPAKREWLRCTRLPSLRCMRPLSLRCALSLRRLLPLSWWTSSLHGLAEPPRTLRFTWPLGSLSNWIAWTPSARVKRVQGYY